MYGNNFYVPNYQQPYYAPDVSQFKSYQQPVQASPLAKAPGDMIWVQGEAGAKAYLIAPNNTVVLWDTESPTIYIKTADASGVPSMRILDFKERNVPSPTTNIPEEKYVTKEQFNEFQQKFEDLTAKYEALEAPKGKKAKGDTDNG